MSPLESDIQLSSRPERAAISQWYPADCPLPSDSDVRYVHELYTPRNLKTLATLRQKILDDVDPDFRDAFSLMLISTSTRTTKCIFVNQYRLSRGVNPAGVWGEKRFWVPDRYIENNVLYYFGERFDRILEGKLDTEKNLYTPGAQGIVSIGAAQRLADIPDETVDYVFTDPPYAGAVAYLNLSTVWNAWLNATPDRSAELTVIAPGARALGTFVEGLRLAVNELFRVVKPDRNVTLCLHFSKLSTWLEVLDLLRSTRWTLVDVEAVEPQKRSHNQVTLAGSVSSDVLVTMKKVAVQLTDAYKTVDASTIAVQLASPALGSRLYSVQELYDQLVIASAAACLKDRSRVRADIRGVGDFATRLREFGFDSQVVTESDYKGAHRSVEMWRVSSAKYAPRPQSSR